MEYKLTIGLEIHAELKTLTKLFCNSKNDPDEKRPNWNVCPVCMGHPGTLPVLNIAAIQHVLRVGLAVGGTLADYTEFDRKNYFYPDIPKGYQVSQYAYPLITGGEMSGVEITRIHLEEDTARSTHPEGGGQYSLVDFNRAGVPLMELVTEPVIKSAEQAGSFARELQLLLRYLGAGDANMEKGEMRVEANISVSSDGNLGTKVEVKNINSFRAVEKAVLYEKDRQIKELENGGVIVQETRGWDENKQQTFSQRLKEDSHDYRYFPDPDIPKLKISEIPEFSHETLSSLMPQELPWEKRKRYEEKSCLSVNVANMFTRDVFFGEYFDSVSEELEFDIKKVKLAANYISSDLAGMYQGVILTSEKVVSAKRFARLIEMVSDSSLSSRGAKDLLLHMVKEDGDPKELAEKLGLLQKSNEEDLIDIIKDLIEKNPQVVIDYKAGKEVSIQFLVGQGMKATKGSANPSVLKELFLRELK